MGPHSENRQEIVIKRGKRRRAKWQSLTDCWYYICQEKHRGLPDHSWLCRGKPKTCYWVKAYPTISGRALKTLRWPFCRSN